MPYNKCFIALQHFIIWTGTHVVNVHESLVFKHAMPLLLRPACVNMSSAPRASECVVVCRLARGRCFSNCAFCCILCLHGRCEAPYLSSLVTTTSDLTSAQALPYEVRSTNETSASRALDHLRGILFQLITRNNPMLRQLNTVEIFLFATAHVWL